MLGIISRHLLKRKSQRVGGMINKLKALSDPELKEWYMYSDAERLIGIEDEHDDKLHQEIEKELMSRGFAHMVDY